MAADLITNKAYSSARFRTLMKMCFMDCIGTDSRKRAVINTMHREKGVSEVDALDDSAGSASKQRVLKRRFGKLTTASTNV